MRVRLRLAGGDAHRGRLRSTLAHLRDLLDAELEGDLAVVDDAVAANSDGSISSIAEKSNCESTPSSCAAAVAI